MKLTIKLIGFFVFLTLFYGFIKTNNTFAGKDYSKSYIYSNKFINEIIDDKKKNVNLSKSNLVLDDSLKKIIEDSIRLHKLSIDSTARLENLKNQRKDNYLTQPHLKRKHPFYLSPSPAILMRTVTIDSSGQFVTIKEKLGDYEFKNSITIPIEQYLELRKESNKRKILEDIGYSYQLKQKQDDLGDLFKDLTKIVIPLPSSDVFSIFGPNQISLSINGNVNILGAWKNEKTEGITTSLMGNEKSEPNFKQTVQINVQGMIGDKLTISADWNTERQFEFENMLKLNYKGYSDEIIQSIEAGNVSLQTTPLIGGSEALFGVKASLKFGPFSLIALASQKKSEGQDITIKGGASSRTYEVRPFNYAENYYFIDKVYADTTKDYNFFYKYYGNANHDISGFVKNYQLKELEVYKSITGLRQPNEFKANAFIELKPKPASEVENLKYYENERQRVEPNNGESEIEQRFVKLIDGNDYSYNPYTGHISFRTQLNNTDIVAVAYRIEGQTNNEADDEYFGELEKHVVGKLDTNAARVLKLVRPKNLQPSYKKAWSLLLKNIYSLGGSKINKEGLKFEIKYEQEIGEPVDNLNGKLLIQAFGLDKTDASNSGQPDGLFDIIPNRTIDLDRGDIIFPNLYPFSTKNVKKIFNLNDTDAEKYSYQAIYDTSKAGAQNDNIHNRYKFAGEMSASSSSTFSLNRTNVVENSVKVYLNGELLVEGKDYIVDYMIGQVTVKKAEALVSGADLQIKFEENDMFALASKTMFGLRGIYDYNKNTSFGFTFLNLSQKTLSDKVRIGEEPISNAIMGFDFKTQFNLPFLTKALDFLFSTSEMSTFSMQGEFAYMNPDPNTKKSNIGGDEGKNIAYIDDFEGAKKLIPIPIFLGSWKDISVPYTANQKDLMKYKTRSFWFNRQNLLVSEIWGDRKKVSSQNRNLTILEYVFLPNVRGAYNSDPDLSKLNLNWSGMMTPLSTVANNLAEENIEYLELWIKIKKGDKDKKLIIDLGQISEDVIPNGILDTEDKNDNNNLDEGEDTGIDGLLDKDEKDYDPVINPDPAGDNWKYDPAFLSDPEHIKLADPNINNTEKNAAFNDNGRIPDTEDLNGNKSLDRVNSFFRYEIPLEMDETRNKYVISSNNATQWYQLRIPLREPSKEINNPSLNVVETIRFWFEGIKDTIVMNLADINLVGNQWLKVKNKYVTELDSVLKLATISFEENPNYEMPPGVNQERDRTNTTEEVFKNEQSLELKLTDLIDGDNREIIKNIPRALDVFNYKEMKLFIHGDKNDSPGSLSYYIDPNNYATEIYFRFGLDTNNFYEYRQPVRKGWNEVRIVFDKLTALKQGRTAEMIRTGRFEFLHDLPGHRIGVKGEPSLTNIKFFIFGVLNPSDKGILNQPVTGDIWLNELRVLDADNSKGLAYTLNSNLKMADIVSLGFVYAKTDPHFHRLQERFGTRKDAQNWSVNASIDFIKMLPFYLPGSKLQLAYAHKEAFNSPLYMPGTDMNVEAAVEQYERNLIANGASPDSARQLANNLKIQSQTMEVSDTYTLAGVQIKIPSNAWYINHTINNLTFNFNYNKTYSRNPTVAYGSQWNWNASMNYQLNFSNENFFKFADIPIVGSLFELFDDYKEAKFFFSPQNFDFIFSLDRNKNYTLNRNVSNPNVSRNFYSKRASGFDWMFTEGGLLNIKLKYGISYNSTYAHLLMDKNNILIEQSEKEIWNSILRGYLFGIDRDFAQDFLLSVNPRLPSFLDLNKFVSLTMNYSSKYDWQNAIEKGELGRSARYNSKLDLSLRVELSRIGDKIFGVTNPQQKTQTQTPARRGSIQTTNEKKADESNTVSLDDSLEGQTTEESEPFYVTGLIYLKNAIQWTLFDYKQFSINFSQINSNTYGALKSENSGFSNFWGWSQNNSNGPSRGFMLGIDNFAGPRASNANIIDLYNHNNTLSLTTSKELWSNARLDVDWKIGWGIQKSLNITTNADGEIESTKIQNFNGTIDRSFWFFPFIGDKIQKIKDTYQGGDKEQLAQDFINNIEDFKIFGSFFGEFFKYIPRPNWKFTWSGLEKISFLKNHLSLLSLNHSYSANYNESWRISPDGINEYQTQRVSVNFSPLIGVSFTLKSFLNGLTGSFNYNLRNNYDVGFSNENLTENISKDINFTATYTKSGFELPLFGLALKNDITASFSFTLTNTSKTLYYLSLNDREKEPLALDGSTRIVIEPKLKYVMSAKVSTTIFYRRTTIDPEGRSSIPKTISNEFGLEVNVQIN